MMGHIKRITLCLLLVISSVAMAQNDPTAADPKVQAYEEKAAEIQQDPSRFNDDALVQLLNEGAALAQPFPASGAVKAYLGRNTRVGAPLWLAAAENARLSGDYRTAVTRYKKYLEVATPSAEAGDAAGQLYGILIQLLGDRDDAYQANSQFGDKMRGSDAAKQFDVWFVEESLRRGDYAAAARRLATVAGENMPAEQQRYYFEPLLDKLMSSLTEPDTKQQAALPGAQDIVKNLRHDSVRQARYGFYVANLAFFASPVAKGKDDEAKVKAYQPVLAAAKAYLSASATADTLTDIYRVFAGGHREYNSGIWTTVRGAKEAMFVEGLKQLSADERRKAVTYYDRASRLYTTSRGVSRSGAYIMRLFSNLEQWATVVDPQTLKGTELAEQLNFVPSDPTLARYQSMARLAQDATVGSATVVRSIARGNGDLMGSVDYFFANEAYAYGAEEIWQLVGDIYGAHASLPENERGKVPDAMTRTMAVGPKHFLPSPAAAIHLEATAYVMRMAFEAKTKDAIDKARLIEILHSMDWAPLTQEQRTKVYASAYNEFKSWTGRLRSAKKGTVSDDVLAQVSELEDHFKKVMSTSITDITKAPTPETKLLAQAMVAVQKKDAPAYDKAARELYKLVSDHNAKKPSTGIVLDYVMANHPNSFDTFKLQCDLLADQLSRSGPELDEPSVVRALALVMKRSGWAWFRIPEADKERSAQLNNVIAQAMRDKLAKNQYSSRLMYFFRGTRRGDKWIDQSLNEDVMEMLIEKKTLLSASDRWNATSAAASYQWMLQNEFQGLRKKYSPESYFDDMFIEEAKKTQMLDWSYWQYGRDSESKIVNFAAQLLAKHDRVPSDSDWPRGDYLNWTSRALSAEPAHRDALLATLEQSYGKTRFDPYAMGRGYFGTIQANLDQNRGEFFNKLRNYADRAAKQPDLVGPPYLRGTYGIDASSVTDAELAAMIELMRHATPISWPRGWYQESMVVLMQQALANRDRSADLMELAPYFWKVARESQRSDLQRELAQQAKEFMDKDKVSVAMIYTLSGLEVLGGRAPDDVRTILMALRSKGLNSVGSLAIAVPPSDPRYPIYAAQMAYMGGKFDTAWDQYLSRRDLVPSMLKELDPAFLIWVISHSTSMRQYDQAESLARQMIQLVDENVGAYEAETRARLLVTYADIAFAREEFPRARAQYERIAASSEFSETRGQSLAELKIAEVDRVTRQFDNAQTLLDKLVRRPDKWVQTQARYQMALLMYDQENWEAAKDELDVVFAMMPTHQEARILQGKIALKIKNYDVARELQVGTAADKNALVPGKPLKVSLQDPSLAVAGSSASIEVRVWTKTGDEERFSLFPFGDDKTKFQGEMPTELGAVSKGDHILQVVGGDLIYYGFANQTDNAALMTPLSVVSDAKLFASSGAILTETELEERRLEEQIRARLKLDDDFVSQQLLNARRAEDQIKPGNRITVRVVDPDRSVSNDADLLPVRVRAANGDEITVNLTETGKHTGVFEGTVATASGQATAYASDSDEGSQPNYAISERDYPAWVGRPDNVRPKLFSVDLNDNITPAEMKIIAGEPGRKLKSFLIQTSINGKDYTTVGSFPGSFEAWDGSMSVETVKLLGRAPQTAGAFKQYLTQDYVTHGLTKMTKKLDQLKVEWDGNFGASARTMGLGSRDNVVAHVYGAFYLSGSQMRTFRVNETGGEATYLLTIDGEAQPRSPMEIRRNLTAGVHRLDLYIVSNRNSPAQFEIQCDTEEPPYMAVAPMEMFDPEKHVQIREEVYIEAAKVTANESGTIFTAEFSPRTRARVVRLVLNDFETDAPAIKRITLVDMKGRQVLPTREDFMKLKENQTLEIVPGDKVTVTYDDPVVLNESARTHETFLTATFSNAELSACFVEYELDRSGERIPKYFPMRRFKAGDRINVFINDPDSDVSHAKDRVNFSAEVYGGSPITLEAVETEPHSGIFLGIVFPVKSAPSRNVELQVKDGQDVILKYSDNENTDPGVPWIRTYYVEQASSDEPEIRVFEVGSRELDDKERAAAEESLAKAGRQVVEAVPVRRALVATRPEDPTPPGYPVPVVHGGPIMIELEHPAIAQSPMSQAGIFVQTESARKAAGVSSANNQFDITVPGTIRLTTTPREFPRTDPPPGYSSVVVHGTRYAAAALDEGRFSFVIPYELAAVPLESLVPLEGQERSSSEPPVLSVHGNDVIYVGFKYKTSSGQETWMTRQVTFVSDVFMDVMDRKYKEPVTAIHVGESLYLRAIHKTLDTSDDKDAVVANITTASGHSLKVDMTESFGHSGIFKGVVSTMYEKEPGAAEAKNTLLLAYGDQITIRYEPSSGEAHQLMVQVHKGSDGQVVPFTKRFKEPKIAVETQFTIAEAYFELAKRHRDLGEEEVARREIAHGKKLLQEAMDDYPDTDAKAQAEYLLANLAYEFGKDAVNEELQRKAFVEAITRFSDIVSSYPDSPYAPKSQYKKALVLERMGEIDRACEEYVKLSYRYPDNELVAETIARLGQYFLTKGKELEDAAAAQKDPVEREKRKIQAFDMYRTSAEVFGRLSERFPNHALSGKTLVLSAQCYMRAEEYDKAVDGFQKVYDDPKTENELAAEALYWAADCYMKKSSAIDAYRLFKKLTWDYPESKWAKFARGRLTDNALIKVAEQDAKGG